jgi:hypothetical protein
MKRGMKIVAGVLVLAAVMMFFAACFGNHLGIPNGDYFASDENGNIIEATQNQIVYTIRGRNVTTHQSFNLDSFDPNGRIVKAGGGTYENNFDHFAFSYRTSSTFGSTKTYLILQISFDKNTGILTVGESFYVRGTGSSAGGPVVPS